MNKPIIKYEIQVQVQIFSGKVYNISYYNKGSMNHQKFQNDGCLERVNYLADSAFNISYTSTFAT